MKRFFAVFLTLACLTALCCPIFAAVECRLPQELPGVKEGVAAYDVLIIGGTPEETTGPDTPAQDMPVDDSPFGPDADGKYATMGDLYQAWGGWEGYPDYICGVWSTDGGMTNMTVAVTDDEAGEQGRKEILSLLQDPGTVTFTCQTYSYGELLEVNEAIVARMMAGSSPIIACGVYEMENKVGVAVLETAEGAGAVARELAETYGDKVFVELGDRIFTETSMGKNRDRGAGVLLLLMFIMGLLAMTAALKRSGWLTNTGRVIAEGKPTRAQVEAALTRHTENPPERVEQELKKKL